MPSDAVELIDGRFGPPVQGGRPRAGGPDWRRIAGMLLVSVVLLAFMGGAGIAGYTWWEITNIRTVPLPDQPERLPDDVGGGEAPAAPEDQDGDGVVEPEEEPLSETINVLLVGSDSREGLTRRELQALGTTDEGTDLTDTVIILQIDPVGDRAAMLSFPRDLLVERCDGTRGRINQAYFIGEEQREGGGAACLVQTVNDETGVYIDHYVRVSFAGFIEAVDAVGGVTFYVDEPLEDRFAGLDIPSGCVHFDGARALGFVRARRLDNGGDYGRIARQQRFARELVRKATSLGTLANPGRLVPLIGSISDTLETDDELDPGVMLDIARSLRNLTAGNVGVYSVPGEAREGAGGAALVEAIEPDATRLYTRFRRGELLPGEDGAPPPVPEPTSTAELLPENVQPLQVLNGTGDDGIAADAAEALEVRGFTIDEVGDADNFGFEATIVIAPPELEAQARVVAEALGLDPDGGSVVPGAAGTPLQVVVGSGFDGDELPEPEVPIPTVEPDADDGDGEDDDDSPNLAEREVLGAELSNVRCE